MRDAVAVQAILTDLKKGAAGTDTHSRHYWDNGAAKFMVGRCRSTLSYPC